jgi:hypothetical protein
MGRIYNARRQALEALERILQDLCGNGQRMGGVLVLLASDVRQALSVISRGTVADELKACLKSSALWKHVIHIGLETNMRVHLKGDSTGGHFAAELLTIGNGKAPVDSSTGLIRFPHHFFNIVASMEALKNTVHFQTFKKMTRITSGYANGLFSHSQLYVTCSRV